jgi:hypothetical protein
LKELDDMQITTGTNPSTLLRRLGLGGFVFFLAKGLLWLTVPYLASVLLN